MSPHETTDPEELRRNRLAIQRKNEEVQDITVELHRCANPERQQELEQQKAAIEKELGELDAFVKANKGLGGRPRVIPESLPVRNIRSSLSKSRKHIHKEMPKCAAYLKKYVTSSGLRFVFQPPRPSDTSE